ncbi:DUF3558 family protein [Umezawaea sp. Da 62-37]|uniref:DUF3558 family protein n=1 Tax=Umezawaea sp. Da 62-37 TaxID=3075927 RepID=UPI0028F7113D|nr:DUF3558 family protein [Umezawaea sp. Da 62-37]WNV83174.1 DUF3558 family protein [Umezawaea sp. Da 62-37]
MITIKSVLRGSLVAASALLAVACSSTQGDTTTTTSTPSSTSTGSSASASPSSAVSGPVTLGDQNKPADASASGARFDPCKVPGWSAFPAAVRPKNEADKPPRQREPKPNDPFTVSCFYDNSEASSTSAAGKHFVATVFWAPPGAMPVDPSNPKNAGGQATTIGGRPGLLRPSTNSASKEPSCGVLIELTDRSTAGVLLVNSQSPNPDQDTCTIAQDVMAAVVTATS